MAPKASRLPNQTFGNQGLNPLGTAYDLTGGCAAGLKLVHGGATRKESSLSSSSMKRTHIRTLEKVKLYCLEWDRSKIGPQMTPSNASCWVTTPDPPHTSTNWKRSPMGRWTSSSFWPNHSCPPSEKPKGSSSCSYISSCCWRTTEVAGLIGIFFAFFSAVLHRIFNKPSGTSVDTMPPLVLEESVAKISSLKGTAKFDTMIGASAAATNNSSAAFLPRLHIFGLVVSKAAGGITLKTSLRMLMQGLLSIITEIHDPPD